MADALVTERPAQVEPAGPLLRAAAVCKTYRTPDHTGRLVLDRLDFSLKEGEIVAILGKSGSGKSTFLRILAGLIPASSSRRARARSPIAARRSIRRSAVWRWCSRALRCFRG
jgi:ABC-type multidrug transport system ATPase subunit